ncbi:MAG: hypothetical protein K9M49_04470 [Candidatus Marinimicrobia bacterium]|nr:hypothetical protein [Candidatus Neomarinimicrobiota bacterium]MCF7904391.1 hypothetical protein [Candidatus Neomarinimicrobiota bacterium]
MLFSLVLSTCAEPNDPPDDSVGPEIPSIDDSSSISIITWNIENFPQSGLATTSRVELVLDSLDADFYCLQEIKDKDALYGIVDRLDQYSVIISDETSFMHLAIVYRHDSFLPVDTNHVYAYDDYNFAGRPPLWVSFKYEISGEEQVLNLIDVHMKCCNDGILRRQSASRMLHTYLNAQISTGDSNFVVPGDWNDDIHDPDSSGASSFEAFLQDPQNFYFVTDSLSQTRTLKNASYPGYSSLIDNILISRSLFDEFDPSGVRVLRLDEVFGDYGTVLSDHRPVLWSFIPN